MPRRPTDWEQIYRETAAEAQRLAKRANQRMVRLERYAERPEYQNILKYAYKKAQSDIQALYGKSGDKLRFTEHQKAVQVSRNGQALSTNENYKANVMQLRAKIKAMESFLGMSSSTIGQTQNIHTGEIQEGLRNVWDRRTNTINERYLSQYGLDLTPEDLRRFFASKKQSKLQEMVGSSNMFVIAAVIQKYSLASNKREMKKFIQNNPYIDMSDYNLDTKQFNSAADMLDTFKDFIDFTNDPILNQYITDCIRQGLNYKNIFLQ